MNTPNTFEVARYNPRLVEFALSLVMPQQAICPSCAHIYTDPLEVEYLTHNRMCLGCEQNGVEVKNVIE